MDTCFYIVVESNLLILVSLKRYELLKTLNNV